MFIYVLVAGENLKLLACPNKITLHCLRPSITCLRSEARPPRTYAPTPRPNSLQIQQPAQVTPGSVSKEVRAAKLFLETLSTTRGAKSVDHEP